MAVGK